MTDEETMLLKSFVKDYFGKVHNVTIDQISDELLHTLAGSGDFQRWKAGQLTLRDKPDEN